MKRLLKKPLVQFVLVGVILLGIQQVVNSLESNNKIEITDQTIQHINSELNKLGLEIEDSLVFENAVQSAIEQELLYRFALENDLSENNELVKQAIAETADQYILSNVDLSDPGDIALESFMEAQNRDYSIGKRLSFQQYFFGNDLLYAQKVLFDSKSIEVEGSEELNKESVYNEASIPAIQLDFGKAFADSIKNQQPAWRGLVPSKYGIHVVIVDEVFPKRKAKLSEVREQVSVNYRNNKLSNYRDSVLNELKEEYEIIHTYKK